MTLRGLFVRINRYLDPLIRDLNGARSDAVAFDALFRGTTPAIDAGLPCYADATRTRVLREIAETFDAATPDDTVVVTFSRHNSPDHHLVLHDSESARLDETCIAMTALADSFSRCRAPCTSAFGFGGSGVTPADTERVADAIPALFG